MSCFLRGDFDVACDVALCVVDVACDVALCVVDVAYVVDIWKFGSFYKNFLCRDDVVSDVVNFMRKNAQKCTFCRLKKSAQKNLKSV